MIDALIWTLRALFAVMAAGLLMAIVAAVWLTIREGKRLWWVRAQITPETAFLFLVSTWSAHGARKKVEGWGYEVVSVERPDDV